MKSIVFSHIPSGGGPKTFHNYLNAYLPSKGWNVQNKKNVAGADLVFVNLGTKDLLFLLKAKLKGIPIVQRLDGLNWEHHEKGTAIKIKFIQEVRNILMQLIRIFFATHVIYQSKYIEESWLKKYKSKPTKHSIIYNGTDIELFSKSRDIKHANFDKNSVKLICVEGTIQDTQYIASLMKSLSEELIKKGFLSKISLIGMISKELESQLTKYCGIEIKGEASKEDVLSNLHDADLFLCLERNPPCPNSVIEALACGLPVVGYHTGALLELVGESAGRVVDFGGDPNLFEKPNFKNISNAIKEITKSKETYYKFSSAARERAEKYYGIYSRLDQYISVFDGLS